MVRPDYDEVHGRRPRLTELFAALHIAVLRPAGPGCLTLCPPPPCWLTSLLGAESLCGPILTDDAFPFLSGFLAVAAAFWRNEERDPLLSDIWVQLDRQGNDLALRATAVTAAGEPYLLIERLEEKYAERRSELQRSRQRGLDNEKLERVSRELLAANLSVERVVRDKSDFLAGMSHDLRTPLNAMRGFSTLLLQGRAGELNPKQTGYVEHVIRAADHLIDLIDDVLDLSKAEAGFLELRPECFAVAESLEEVLTSLTPLAQAKGITIESTSDGFSVTADRVRFRQILYNLLSNAVKFAGPAGLISITASDVAEWLEFRIRDSGTGIPPSEQDSIFGRYYRANTTNEGTGLGLAIARQLVEQHGGNIRVESAPGAGSCFIFRIPATFNFPVRT
jgi:signal transduction histidine kinase